MRYCQEAAAWCSRKKCIDAPREPYGCPRTLPQRKAVVTQLQYEKREAAARQRIWKQQGPAK